MLVAQLLAAVERLAPAGARRGLGQRRPDRRAPQPARAPAAGRPGAARRGAGRGPRARLRRRAHPPPADLPVDRRGHDDGAAGELVLRAAEDRVAVMAAHTNLDACRGGLNDVMAEILGITAAEPAAPGARRCPSCGLGRIGAVRPTTLSGLVERGARRASAPARSPTPATPGPRCARVACCTGSGGLADRRRPRRRGRRLRHQRPASTTTPTAPRACRWSPCRTPAPSASP